MERDMTNIPELVARVQQAMADYRIGAAQVAAGTEKAHAAVIAYGRALLEKRKTIPGDVEFGKWVRDNGFDTEKPWDSRQERYEAMQIAEAADRPGTVSEFIECGAITPTNMMKWYRVREAEREALAADEARAEAELKAKQEAEAAAAVAAEAEARRREEAELQAKREAEARAASAAEAEVRRKEREAAEAAAMERRRQEEMERRATAEKQRKEREGQKESRSKLNDLLGPIAATTIRARFKHPGIFFKVFERDNERIRKKFGNHIALMCQTPDYPLFLLDMSKWTLQMLYPHLPIRFLDLQPKSFSRLTNIHATLIEVERRFKQTPEFLITEPPLVGFNKVMELFNIISRAKEDKSSGGGGIDPRAKAKPEYRDDEGRPEVVICGTRLWPITHDNYNYDDLRCAYGFVEDVFRTFLEPRESSVDTKLLKVRHLLSWVNGGYNAKGATLLGTFEALDHVVTAYARNLSSEMKTPGVRFDKNDGNARA